MAVLYTEGKTPVEAFYPEKPDFIRFELNTPPRDIQLTEQYIYIICKDKVQIYRRRTHRLLRTLLMPGVQGLLEMGDESILVYRADRLQIFDSLGHIQVNEEYKYIQTIEDSLVVVFEEGVRVYQDRVGEVYRVPIGEFERRYCPIFDRTDNGCVLKRIWFSIHSRKLYVLADSKVVGRDLNVYLDDYSKARLDIAKFQCIQKAILLLDKVHRKLYMVSKGLKTLFTVDCDDFGYSTRNALLFVLYGNGFSVFQYAANHEEPFRLIENNIVYVEDEDEFDESDESDVDICDMV